MRSGRGVMHEEMWETRPDRTTKVELFQLWVNLPSKLKMSAPSIRYVGQDWGSPYAEEVQVDTDTGLATRVRTFGDAELLERAAAGPGDELQDPPFQIRYASLPPGGSWTAAAQGEHTAICYVRSGTVQVNALEQCEVSEGATCRFAGDGENVWLVNPGKVTADVLLLTGAPLGEPVALGGPVVMNTQQQVQEAYSQLRDGTFLSES